MAVTVIFMIFVTVVMAFVSRMRVSRMIMPFLLMAAKMPVIVITMIMIVPFLCITVLMGRRIVSLMFSMIRMAVSRMIVAFVAVTVSTML